MAEMGAGDVREFFIAGNPKGRVHTRAAVNPKTHRIFTRPDGSVEQMSWTAAVRDAALAAMRRNGFLKIERGAVALAVEFVMPRPKKYYWKGPHAEPRCCGGIDLGNLTKALEDALKGVVWRDDGQVSEYWHPYRRRYARPGEVCGARVRVWALGEWEEAEPAAREAPEGQHALSLGEGVRGKD